MGMTFRPPAHATQAIFEIGYPDPAPLEETFRAMITQVLAVGTFHGSLDYDALFDTSYVEKDIQIASHKINAVRCALEDNMASLTAPQMTPGKMVRQILDPVLADVFKICPSWQLDRTERDVWYGRVELSDGLSVIIRCAPLVLTQTTPPAAHATIEVAATN